MNRSSDLSMTTPQPSPLPNFPTSEHYPYFSRLKPKSFIKHALYLFLLHQPTPLFLPPVSNDASTRLGLEQRRRTLPARATPPPRAPSLPLLPLRTLPQQRGYGVNGWPMKMVYGGGSQVAVLMG